MVVGYSGLGGGGGLACNSGSAFISMEWWLVMGGRGGGG